MKKYYKILCIVFVFLIISSLLIFFPKMRFHNVDNLSVKESYILYITNSQKKKWLKKSQNPVNDEIDVAKEPSDKHTQVNEIIEINGVFYIDLFIDSVIREIIKIDQNDVKKYVYNIPSYAERAILVSDKSDNR